MKHLKIGIIEDDLLIAESIVITLRQIGYRPALPARDYHSALKMIESESPDLLLIDITLVGERDGIELAMKVNHDYGIPFIFLTALSDSATVNRAKKANPYAYLVKPFSEHDLFSSIEIAFNNFNRQIKSASLQDEKENFIKDAIFVKEGELYHKVKIDEIRYVESDNVYLNIYTEKNHYVARIKLDDFVNDLANADFQRVHRSFAVNMKHLETINHLTVVVGGKNVPLNKTYKAGLMQRIKSIT